MKARDRDYIEDRLLAPAVPLTEAIERLYETGDEDASDAAAQLGQISAELHDACREVRHKLWYPERG